MKRPTGRPTAGYILVNSGGKLFRIPSEGGAPAPFEFADLGEANNDHGISRDGSQYAVSAEKGNEPSKIYVVSADGKNARLVTAEGPSYFHGWSPDSRWLAYCAERGGNSSIYRVTSGGGRGGPPDQPSRATTTVRGTGPTASGSTSIPTVPASWDIWRMPAQSA